MGGTKRMSMEEKRKVVLDIYHQTKSVYTEKEILALAVKAGVNQGTCLLYPVPLCSVADVNNALVDDGIVSKEKIGGSNYFWSFPAKKDRLAQIEHQKTLAQIEKLQTELDQATSQLADAKRGRENDDGDDQEGGRAAKLARLAVMAKERAALEQEYAKLKENDPAVLADLEKELNLVTQAAHRWTDNIFNCQSYLVKKRGMEKKQVYRMLGITGAFDYPEDKPAKK
eukprot:scaffold2657_cov89-Amphora_coffeaeformis.AAC.29